MSYCELYARRVIAELEPLLRPAGRGAALPCPSGSRSGTPCGKSPKPASAASTSCWRGRDGRRFWPSASCVAVHVYPETAVYLREHAHIGAVTVESAAQLLGGEGYAFAPGPAGGVLPRAGGTAVDGGIAVARLPRAARGGRAAGRLARRREPPAEALAGICRRFSPAEPLHPFFARPELPDRLTGELKRLAAAEEAGELARRRLHPDHRGTRRGQAAFASDGGRPGSASVSSSRTPNA